MPRSFEFRCRSNHDHTFMVGHRMVMPNTQLGCPFCGEIATPKASIGWSSRIGKEPLPRVWQHRNVLRDRGADVEAAESWQSYPQSEPEAPDNQKV